MSQRLERGLSSQTDACFDPETFSGIGAVLADSNGKLQDFFPQETDELKMTR